MRNVKEKHPGEHRYLTHDNGARPFLVYVGDTVVTVYQAPQTLDSRDHSYDEIKNSYTKLVKKFTGVEKKFIPKYPTINSPRKGTFERTGNSVLLKLKTGYAFIGDVVYSFKTKDEIKKFYSPVENSDVPYPVAVGTENVYFMLDKKYVPKKLFPKGIDWERDAYTLFYDGVESKDFEGVKLIQGLAR